MARKKRGLQDAENLLWYASTLMVGVERVRTALFQKPAYWRPVMPCVIAYLVKSAVV
jgi:hypothetical protein